MKAVQKMRNYAVLAIALLLLSLAHPWEASGAEPPSLPPGDKQQLDSTTLESGVRITDTPSRNEALNKSHAGPAMPPPSSPPSAAPSGGGALSPLPPLSGSKF